MDQGALPLQERPPATLAEAMRAEFQRSPRHIRKRGYMEALRDPLLRHCLELGARARLRQQEKDDG